MASPPRGARPWPVAPPSDGALSLDDAPPEARGRTGLLSEEALRVGGLILGWKLATFIVIVVASLLFPFDKAQYDKHFRFRDTERIDLRVHLKTWDGQHYLFLAHDGYNKGQGSNAFYPLLPTLVAGVEATGLEPVPAGLLVTNVASFAALVLLYVLVKRRYSQRIAWLTLLLLISFPTAYYLNLVYTEGLFLLLAAAFFYGLSTRDYRIVVLSAFLLPMVRFVGIFCVVPLVITLFLDWRSAQREAAGVSKPAYWLLLAPLAGLGVYFAYMQLATGDALVAQHAQRFYDANKSVDSLLDPLSFFRNLFRGDLVLHGFRNSILDRAFFVWFLASLPLVYRRVDLPMFGFCVCLGLIPLLGSFESYMRYVMIAFPLYIAYAGWFASHSQRLLGVTLVAMGALQVVFLASHSLNHWVA